MVNPETRSELAIPMIHKGTVIGVLDLESPQLNYFTEDHVQALSILAAQLAIALENARLYEKVARDEARMERELQAAQRMQGALLRPVPADDFGVDLAARILSAREVCGDLYDFLRYGPTRLGFGLGDVSGKGSAAALYGAVAIGILRSMAPQKLLPAELLRQLNQLICERRIEGRFMTFCFATWRKPTRKLRIANAGQTQPLLYRRRPLRATQTGRLPAGNLRRCDLRGMDAEARSRRHSRFPLRRPFGSPRSGGQLFRYPADRIADRAERRAYVGRARRSLARRGAGVHARPAITDDRTLVVMKVK